MKTDIADINRAAWSQPDAVAEFSRSNGFIEEGERAALLAVASRVRGQPALDVGVGAGRTVPLLRLLTDDYIAVDYSPELVEACRRKHPGVDVRVADARHLSAFAAGSFGFVFFSFSGFDAVAHDDRAVVLREFHRILRPRGWLAFSTHNIEGPSYGEVPWRGYGSRGPIWYRALRWLMRSPLNLGRYARSWMNWWRNRGLNVEGEGWAVRVSAPQEFGIALHYVRLAALLAEVSAAGFTNLEVYGSNDGARVHDGTDTSGIDAFYVVAQKDV